MHWANWNESAPYRLGIEEELMLLDVDDLSLTERIDDVVQALPAELERHVATETHQAAAEIATDPHAAVGPVVAQLGALREAMSDVAEGLGIQTAAAGTHPFATWDGVHVTTDERHQLIRRTMRSLAQREPTFALHVHVGVADPGDAIELMNRLRVHVPLLLALSGNSPYWQGRDAGFASTRTMIFQAFPRTGLPRRFRTYEEWVDVVEVLLRSDAIPEPTFLWWDLRPQPRLGTVELRVMDAQRTPAETAALAALVQAVARLELEERHTAEGVLDADEALAENRFLAARDGVDAALIDPIERRRVPVRSLLERLVAAAAPHARALGCADELDGVWALADRPGAARQRAVVRDGGSMSDVVADLIAAFGRSQPLAR
jgi:carboxylate-amine ligase